MTPPRTNVLAEGLASLTEPRLVTEVPGPRARELIDADARVTSPSLPRAYAFVPLRGAGSMVEDVDGNVFLDLNAGIAVCSTGHAHPDVVKAIAEQAERLLHYSASDFFLPIYAETCARLDSVAPMSRPTRTFLTNSGTEAVEAAIKLARNHTGRQYLIAFIGSFHGRSYGSVSLTASKALYHEGFGPMLPGVLHAPYGETSFIEDAIFERLVPPTEVAAIVVEPILGEGGYVVPPPSFLPKLRELCDRHGILLVCDEVQSGVGRTGKMFACEHEGVEPDILLSAKGLGSGMPIGAIIAKESIMKWRPGAHGSTFGGNPVCCAAALATLDVVEHELLPRVPKLGERLLAGARRLEAKHAAIGEVRGRGLMVGVEFVKDRATREPAPEIPHDLTARAFRKGLLLLGAGKSTLRLAPPLVVDEQDVDAALAIIDQCLAEMID